MVALVSVKVAVTIAEGKADRRHGVPPPMGGGGVCKVGGGAAE